MFSIPNLSLRLLLGSVELSLCSNPSAPCVAIPSKDVPYPRFGVGTGQFHDGKTVEQGIKGTEAQLQYVSEDGFNILCESRAITTQNDMTAFIPVA